jgi:hypothetical protein
MSFWERINRIFEEENAVVSEQDAPEPIRNGLRFYIEPNQADFDVLSVVYDVLDARRIPRVVVSMPYWTRTLNRRSGLDQIQFHRGVNVMNIAGGNQDNTLPVSRYALMEPQPVVPEEIVNWISR